MRRVKIYDVASRAGVSITTVSRVLHNSPAVKESTRKRVEKAIRELEYLPDASAQRLAQGGGKVIALTLPYFRGMFSSFYISKLIEGIARGCSFYGYDLLIHTQDRKKEDFFKKLTVGRVSDGIILSDECASPQIVRGFKEAGFPFVVLNRTFSDSSLPWVTVDNRRGGWLATYYLIEKGHRKIAILCGDLNSEPAKERFEGYLEALRGKGLPLRKEWIINCYFSPRKAKKAIHRLLKLKNSPTAIFVSSDLMALGAYEALREEKLKIPQDISLVGFDDSFLSREVSPPLTTIHQPLSQMGEKAVKILIALLEGKRTKLQLRLPVRLIERASVK